MPRTFGLIGVPSSAGVHWPGQEKAPAYLRAAGLVDHLSSKNNNVVDYGDLPRVRCRLDPNQRKAQNLVEVIRVAQALAKQVERALGAGHTPLVIGGDCTITVGAISGFLRHGTDVALLYFDGGWDLYTPETAPEGILDSTGVAHMLGEPGASEDLVRIGPRVPLLPEERVFFFGQDQGTPEDAESAVLARRPLVRHPAERVRGRASQAAAEMCALLEAQAKTFAVHFDVDVIDFVDFPIADVPQFNSGLTFREAMDCLRVFCASPHFGGLVVTEFIPDHADEEGHMAEIFVKELTAALTGNPHAQ